MFWLGMATSVYEKLAVNQKFQIRYLILINCMVQIPKKLSLKKSMMVIY